MSTLLEIGLSNALVAVLLALVAAAASRFIRRPALTHCLWLLVLIKLITPPLVYVPLPEWRTEAAADLAKDVKPPLEAPAAERPSEPAVMPDPELIARVLEEARAAQLLTPPPAAVEPVLPAEPIWPALLAAAWLAGMVIFFGISAIQVHRFRRLLRFARPADAELVEQARAVAARLGLANCPAIALVPGAVSPMLWALGGSTRLLLPLALLERLDGDQRATLIAHELAHWRRRDHWVRVLELAVTGIYWWHPVVWWARSELRETEEQCCDAWVVGSAPESARPYALALLETVNFLAGARPALPPAASGIGHRHLLQRRLTMIMQGRTPKTLSWLGAVAVIALGALVLPILPTLAQTESHAKPATTEPAAAPATADYKIHTLVGRQHYYSKEYCTQCHTATTMEDATHCVYMKAQDDYKAVSARLQELQERLAKMEGRDNPRKATAKQYTDALNQLGYVQSKPLAPADADTARDEAELLEVQLKGKEAQLREVEVRLEQSLAESKRFDELAKSGAVSAETVLKARNEPQILRAQLDAKRAEVQEVQVRLAQAKRRMKQAAPEKPKPVEPPPTFGTKLPPAGIGQPDYKIFRLKNGEAQEFAAVLQQLFSGRTVRMVADPRTNSLIVAGSREDMMLVEALVLKLDEVATDAARPRMPGGMPGMMGGGAAGMGGAMASGSSARATTPGGGTMPGGLAPGMGGSGPGVGAGAAGGPLTKFPMGGGSGTMSGPGGGKGAPMGPGGADSDQRFKQLEEKLDRLERILQKMEAERTQERIDRDVKKALDSKK
jgi:beta-lactamase regulating signal transducer with metallopeptidase domain